MSTNESRSRTTWVAVAVVALLAGGATDVRAQAQTTVPAGRLMLTVSDPSGAVIPNAQVELIRQDGPAGTGAARVVRRVATSATGVATFDEVAPGRYTVTAAFPGFETVTVPDVDVESGESRREVVLPIEKVTEDLVIGQDGRTAALDPRGAAFSTVLTREQIEALPDDPDEMEAVLKAMSPPGATLRIDGFTGGQLPPKQQIRSIRLPRMDAMAAQYHGGLAGALHIEVLTRPGGGPLGGSIDMAVRDDALNARNPFAPDKGDEGLRQGGVTLSGGIVPGRSSFSVTLRGASVFDTGTLLAAVPGGTLAETVRQPGERVNLHARFDQALTADHAMRVTYTQTDVTSRNRGVGGFDLAERAFADESRDRVLRISEDGPVGRRFFSESRLQVRWSASDATSVLEAPTVRVLDAFTAGGAQRRGGTRAIEFEAATDLDYVRGNHGLRTGVLLEGGRHHADDITNYFGTWTYASLADYEAGRPSNYTRRIGDPEVRYTNLQVGAYVQDDYRVAKSLLLSYGVRVEAQTLIPDQNNVLPRVSLTWSPFESGRTTIRGGWGRFTDWIGTRTYEQTLRFDGVSQQEINVVDPAFPEPGGIDAALPSNRYVLGDGLVLPESVAANLGVNQSVTDSLRLSATYTHRRGSKLLRGRNLNAPIGGVRPDPAFANLVEVVGDAESRMHSLGLSATLIKLDWRRTFFSAHYTLMGAETNGTGPFSLPANGDDLAGEWGASTPRHQFGGTFNSQPFGGLGVALNVRGQSGAPYDVTTGSDDNGDGVFNDRPAGTSRNAARTSARWDVGLRLSYAIGFGGPRDQPAGGGTMIVMTRGGGGGGMPGGVSGGAADSRYRAEFYVSAQNVTNRLNYVGYSGVMTSPFFGQPTNVLSPRKLEVGTRIVF
jgi:hypothetical protein